MQFILAMIAVLGLTSTAYATQSWDRFEGCFDTTAVNGTPVTESTNYYKSAIKYSKESLFTRIDGRSFNSLSTTIIVKKDGSDTIIGFPLAFIDAPGAVVIESGDDLVFRFDGSVINRSSGQTITFKYETIYSLAGDKVHINNGATGEQFDLVRTKCPF